MTLPNECKKSYLEILQDIFNDRQVIKINIMTKRESKLAVKENLPTNEEKILEDLNLRLLKRVKISMTYIIRKYKVTPEKARELIITASTHECWDWNGMLIDYYSPEFHCCCNCFGDDS